MRFFPLLSAPRFSAYLFFCDHVVFFFSIFSFPSLSLSLAFGLFTAYFDAQPISCQHGPCRRSAKGYFLRLRVCVCERLWSSIYDRSTFPLCGMPACSRIRAAARSRGNNFIDVLSTVSAEQETRRLTFKHGCKSSRCTLEIILPKQSLLLHRHRQVCVFSESMQCSSCQRRFGKACNLHDFRQWLNSAPSP